MNPETKAEKETALDILMESDIKGSDYSFLKKLIHQYYILKVFVERHCPKSGLYIRY